MALSLDMVAGSFSTLCSRKLLKANQSFTFPERGCGELSWMRNLGTRSVQITKKGWFPEGKKQRGLIMLVTSHSWDQEECDHEGPLD